MQTKLYNDIAQRRIGTLDYTDDVNGKLTYVARDNEDTAAAIGKSLASGFISNMVETYGGKVLDDIISMPFSRLTNSAKWKDFKNTVSQNPIGHFMQSAGYQGGPSEFLEELLDSSLNAILVGDQSLSDVYSGENIAQTAGVTLLTSLFMGTSAGITSAHTRSRINKQMNQAEQMLADSDNNYTPAQIEQLTDIAQRTPNQVGQWLDAINNEINSLIDQSSTNGTLNPIGENGNATARRIRELIEQRDYVLAAAQYNAYASGLRDRVQPAIDAATQAINDQAHTPSAHTIKANFKGNPVYITGGDLEVIPLSDGNNIVLPNGSLYTVQYDTPNGPVTQHNVHRDDIEFDTAQAVPTEVVLQQGIDAIYNPITRQLDTEKQQAADEEQSPTSRRDAPAVRDNSHRAVISKMLGNEKTDNWLLSAYELRSTPVGSSDIDTEPIGMQNGTAALHSTSFDGKDNKQFSQSQDITQLSDTDFDTHIDTLSPADAITAIRSRRGDEDADQYAAWRKAQLTRERDAAKKKLTRERKPFNPAKYPGFAEMKAAERDYYAQVEQEKQTLNEQISTLNAQLSDIEAYLIERNKQIAAEREAENPLQGGISQAVRKQPINTLEQYIAREIALGARLRLSDNTGNGLAAELGITPGSQEHRELLSILSNTEGLTPEQWAEYITENIEPEYAHLIRGCDTQDIRNTIIDTIHSGVTSRRRAYQFIADANQQAADEKQRYYENAQRNAQSVGQFGPIYTQFKGKPQDAIAFLSQMQDGEAVAALNHPEIGDIDLVWGNAGTGKSDGFGLAKLVAYHPEVLSNLQEIINDMHVTQRTENRVQLESDTHQAAVRLTWDNEKKNWLLTAFEKKNSASDNTTDTGETSSRGKQNDTATLQNTVSEDKDSERREKNKISSLNFSSEPNPILSKDSERREKNKISSLNFSSEPNPILSKNSERREKNNNLEQKSTSVSSVLLSDIEAAIRDYEEYLLSSLSPDDLAAIDIMNGDYWDEIQEILQYEQEAYSSLNTQPYDTYTTSSTPQDSHSQRESQAIQPSIPTTQSADTRQGSQTTEPERPQSPAPTYPRSTRTDAVDTELDENGHPFMTSSDGTTTFGYITENTGLQPAPIKLSEGYQDENGKGYGLAHINANHGEQIRNAGFASVEKFVSFVAQNYDEDNIKVGKSRAQNGNTTYLIQVTDLYDNTLFIELSRDGSYWNVNSGGVFRKGYANKKETVVKTEPQQPNNAVSTGSSLSAEDKSGISTTEPNGEPTVSNHKDSERREKNKISSLNFSSEPNPILSKDTTSSLNNNNLEDKIAYMPNIYTYIQHISDKNSSGIQEWENAFRNYLIGLNNNDIYSLDQSIAETEKHLKRIKKEQGVDNPDYKAFDFTLRHLQARRNELAPNSSTASAPAAIPPQEQGYTITPAKYTTKRGKVLNMQLVKFSDKLTKEQISAGKELAKADKGWYDSEQDGFMMRSEDSAKQFAETFLNDENAVSEAQPITISDIQSPAPTYPRSTRTNNERGASQTHSTPQEKEIIFLDPQQMSDAEKQRRGDMLRNTYAIEVQKNVIKSTPDISARKAAEQWWDENVAEPVLYDTEVGEVEINKNTVESSLAHRYGQKKLDAITSLIDGFENAVYLGTMPDSRERGVVDHYFAYPIMYDGELNYVFCRAMQDANKNRLYVHEVFLGAKIKKGDTLQTAASKPHGGISLYRDILANVLYDKDTTTSLNNNNLNEKIAQASAHVNTNPTEQQSPVAPDAPTSRRDAPVVRDNTQSLEFRDDSLEPLNTKLSTLNPQPPSNPSGNRLVTDERYAELRERMRKKLGGQMNIGIDPEILAIGTEMAVYHLEKGARKFTEYAKAMIADLGDAIRPYLKAFYNGARELPEVIETGLADEMTPYSDVQQFDVANFDLPTTNPIATAQTIARETEVNQQVETAKQRIKQTTQKKKSLSSPSNQLNLFDNESRQQDTRTDNSGTQTRREELPETQSVESRTPLQHPVENSSSERRNTRIGSSQSRNRPLYDVNKNYTNDEIADIVSSVTDIVDGKVVITGDVTDDIKAICRQFKSGGVAKQGRGILDEYYTDGKIVDAVNLIIAPYFKGAQPARVLEPSIGIGNFINAVDNIPTSQVVAFEINDTTARIAKVLYPDVDINLRSFETEFIDDSGKKKPLPQKFNLVIGNPPYGSHRGLYKGLGEESNIARYEDYFVKRSLDVLQEGGVLAMVLPSSWIDRHTRYGGYTIEAAYRLPSGAFEATQVGTDIVVLRKDSSVPVTQHTPYFEQHPERILGETKQRKGRYGRMEQYVEGNIDTAIEAIKREQAEQISERLGIEATNDNLNNIQAAIDETGSTEKAIKSLEFRDESTSQSLEMRDESLETLNSKHSTLNFHHPKHSTLNPKHSSKYKLSLSRGVDTVPTSQQFSHQFSDGEVEAFADTNYDGTIDNPGKHRKYANYIGGRFLHDFYYAEGNIYDKLAQLEQEKDKIIKEYGIEQYNKQKQLLENVLPKRKGLSEISISPNTAFVKNLKISTTDGYTSLKDMFIAFCRNLPRQAFGYSSSWEVIEYVNNEQVYGQDKQRNQLIRERRKKTANDLFGKFLNEELSDDAKRQVVAAFNREYNSTYRPDYSRVPMFSTINNDFKGKPLKLTSVQLAGIGRMTVKGVGLLAHEVGFGKTLSGILSMHEAMTRGFASKPLIVVPNDNILKQWIETINEVIPQATVNSLGNLGTSYDLTDFKVNDGEFTIVTYEGLKAMSFSDDTYNRLADRFSYITEDLNKHQSERDYQKELEKHNELKGKMKRGAKKTYNFEDFGFDWLTVDEVHNANHIVSKVRLDKSVASDFRSQSQRTSDLGLKTWLAAQYIQEENDGRNVLLLSATPFTNKPLEYYSILSLIANNMLRRKGFFNVDQFFETFMEADNELEIAANGRPTQKTNIRRFRNNGLFQQLLSEFIDIKGEEDNPELVRPERHNKEYKIAQNDLTDQAVAAAQDLLSDNDTVLQGIGHARAAAFSPYATSLLGESPRDYKEFVNNSPKIDATIKLIEQNKKDRPDAGQIIYSEVGVEFFPMIRDYLVNETGFKPGEVRIITGATSNNERIAIQTAFNKGDVKVVIGSPAIKEGLNLQENTTDMYILSLPWNFTQLRQIEGRGWRQGNKWENIRINYMLTNDSVDVFMLQRLQLKQGLYNEAMKSGAESLDVSDIDTSELKTALITDPATRAEIVTIRQREKLEQQKTQIEADLSFVLRKFEAYNKLIEKLETKKNEIAQLKKWAADGNTYWAERAANEENKLGAVAHDIQEEKQRLQKKGVNVDEIEAQTEQSQKAIEDINEQIENLKDYQQQLTDKYSRENEEKERRQGNLLDSYLRDRADENKSGFYKIRPKESEKNTKPRALYRSINPGEPVTDYAQAVVENNKQPSQRRDAPVVRDNSQSLEFRDESLKTLNTQPSTLNSQHSTLNFHHSQSPSQEEQSIIDRAKADGTYLLAPNGKPTNLTPRQWVQVRTEAFKQWFGDWQKAARVNKLRYATDAEITGNEIVITDNEKQNKKNALEYGKTLQGEYTNKDTGNTIQLQRGRKNGGINEVLQHNYKDAEHLQSIAAIPQIIVNSIFVEEVPNEDTAKNPDVVSYQHYVCGLKIGNTDYTVHSLVAIDKKGDRYYDHNLIHIEKIKLLDIVQRQAVNGIGFGTTPDTESTTNSDYKDKRLLSILQTNASKIVDENGEPRVMYHGTNADITTFLMQDGSLGRGAYFTSNWDEAAEYAKKKQGVEDIEDLDESKVLEVFLNVRDENNITHSRFYREDIEVLATNPNQIKSATDNIGTFDNRSGDIRFRSINPGESLTDYAQAVVSFKNSQEDLELIDAAIVRFRENFNASDVIKVDDLAHLRRLYSDMTDNEFNDFFKIYSKTSGFYDADRNKIYIFAENTLNAYTDLVHEATHAAVQKLYNSENLADKLGTFINEIETLHPNFFKRLGKVYQGDTYINEAVSYTLDQYLHYSSIEKLLEKLSPQAQQELLPILNTIGYEKGRIQHTKEYAQIFDTSRARRTRKTEDGTTYDRSIGEWETSPTIFQKKQKIADNTLSTLDDIGTSYSRYIADEWQAAVDAAQPRLTDDAPAIARKIMFRAAIENGKLKHRDNLEREKFLQIANKISDAKEQNDARHGRKRTTVAESHYDAQQRLKNLVDDIISESPTLNYKLSTLNIHNPWLTQNQAKARAQAQTRIFDATYRQPLYEAITDCIRVVVPNIDTSNQKQVDEAYNTLSLYAQARTALERQKVKEEQARAEAEAAGEEYIDRDFAGLAGVQFELFSINGAIDDEVKAAKGNLDKLSNLATERDIPLIEDYVTSIEERIGNPEVEGTKAHRLWQSIQAISEYQLSTSYNAGITSRAGYQVLTYGTNIDAMLREKYNTKRKAVTDNPGSYDNVTSYDKNGNAAGTHKVLNEPAKQALKQLAQEYSQAIENVPMPSQSLEFRDESLETLNPKHSTLNSQDAPPVRDEAQADFSTLVKNGWLSEEEVASFHRYYRYYMPLKGHAELTAEDVETYEQRTPRNQSKIKAVEGHTQLAKDPFNQLILDTHGVIQNAEQNRWKTDLYNLLVNNPNSSQYVVEQRYYRVELDIEGNKRFVPYGTIESIDGQDLFVPGTPTQRELAAGTAVAFNNRNTEARLDIPIRRAQRDEHTVTVYVGGEPYTIFFYDKRIADAITGRNIKKPTDVWKGFDTLQKVNRLYAGLKTSLNPTFMLVSNLPRDWAEMTSNNFIEHGASHALTSFMYRLRATWFGDVQKAVRKYQKGKLLTMKDAKTETERYVVEFFNNGGPVNITQLPDYDTAKVELIRDIEHFAATGKMREGSKVIRTFNNAAERVELAPRLATYIASRKMGRPITESINDAKEATVNFDRKGSWSGVMGLMQLFYNASAQSVRRQIDLARRHPVRFATTYAAIAATSAISNIIISYIISAMLAGDDEDKQQSFEDICRNYFAVNPELRRHYNVIMVGDTYVRIPMAVNYLPYVTLGDAVANAILNPNARQDNLKNSLDITSAILDTFTPAMIAQPIGFAFDVATAHNERDKGNAIQAMTMSALNKIPVIEPLIQSLGNYNFMGGTLYNTPYDRNSQEPAYMRARNYTQPIWVWASQALNDVTGGNEVKAGAINIPPEAFENIMGIFGGIGEYGENIASLIEQGYKLINDEETDAEILRKSFPLVSRLYGGNVQDRYNKAMQSIYYDDITALAKYTNYRKAADTPELMEDFNREYTADEQLYYADLATIKKIHDRIKKSLKMSDESTSQSSEFRDESLEKEKETLNSQHSTLNTQHSTLNSQLTSLYELANRQYQSLASGNYKPVSDTYYVHARTRDMLLKTPYRTADGTYVTLGKLNKAELSELLADNKQLYDIIEMVRSIDTMYNDIAPQYYPGKQLDNVQQQRYNSYIRAIEARNKTIQKQLQKLNIEQIMRKVESL